MAPPDAIARLSSSGINAEAKELWDIYFKKQQHSSLAAFMSHVLQYDDSHFIKKNQEGLLVQVKYNFLPFILKYRGLLAQWREHSILTIVGWILIKNHSMSILSSVLLPTRILHPTSEERIALFIAWHLLL